MRQLIFLITAFPFFSSTGIAQMVLKGNVVEAGTVKPVAAASVFISNSSTGTVTGEAGNFALGKLPAGKFTLVVSCIGYGTYVSEIDPLHLPAQLIVELRHKRAELNEAVVSAHDRNGWVKWGDLFIEHFIGKSAWAGACRIKNPRVLKFSNSYKNNILKAWADEPLLIENRALGYIISYDLHAFSFNFSTNTVAYSGYALFTEITDSNSKTVARNRENRRKVYAVSLLHFIRSLYNNTSTGEGFRIVRTVNKIQGALRQTEAAVQPYSGIEEYDTVYEISNRRTLVNIIPAAKTGNKITGVATDDRLSIGNILQQQEGKTALYFTDTLQVVYTKASVPFEYLQYDGSARPGNIVSAMFLLQPLPVSIFANGSYTEASNLGLAGFWAWWEKIAIMLPYDYQPEEVAAGNIKTPAGN